MDPPSEAGKVHLSTTSNIGIISGTTQTSGGVISFDVLGLTKSAAKGDASITAKHDCGLSIKQTVTVVVPARVGDTA